MPKPVQLKNAMTDNDVSAFIASIEDNELRADSEALLELFSSTTKFRPRLWGDSMIGFGSYTYTRSNGAEGECLATGFSPRKSGPTIYIMPGYHNYDDILKDLGPHKLGKSCLYLKRLSDIKQPVLKKLIKQGLVDLRKTHPVSPT